MAHRRIGQERLGFAASRTSGSSLDELAGLIEWEPVAVLLKPIHASAKGEAAWPPLAMFKALVAVKLDRALFAAVSLQLKAKAVRVKTGTIVDATIIASASKDDDDARWVKPKGRPAVHGFKAHVGADADTALVEAVTVTPANVNDGRAGPDALPDAPGEVFADSAYRGAHFREAIHAKGGTPRIAVTAMWGLDEKATLAKLAAFNAPIHRVRSRIEKIFGTWKRSYGLRRMRWLGIAKAASQVHLTAIAYNLKRALTLIAKPV